jgi:hypothetical protein
MTHIPQFNVIINIYMYIYTFIFVLCINSSSLHEWVVNVQCTKICLPVIQLCNEYYHYGQ